MVFVPYLERVCLFCYLQLDTSSGLEFSTLLLTAVVKQFFIDRISQLKSCFHSAGLNFFSVAWVGCS